MFMERMLHLIPLLIENIFFKVHYYFYFFKVPTQFLRKALEF